MWVAWNPAAVSAFCASTGYRESASTSAACGAISRSAMSRTASRIASCSSLRAYSPVLLPTGTDPRPPSRRVEEPSVLRRQPVLEGGVPGHHGLGQLGLEAGHRVAERVVG